MNVKSTVICPYYIYDDGKRRLTCEGICEGCKIELVFRKKNLFETQLETFCKKWYENCEVYRMVNTKYEE